METKLRKKYFMVVACLVGPLLVYYGFLRISECISDFLLFNNGIENIATITELTENADMRHCRYVFSDGSGYTYEGKESFPVDLQATPELREGSPLGIIYLRRAPKVNRVRDLLIMEQSVHGKPMPFLVLLINVGAIVFSLAWIGLAIQYFAETTYLRIAGEATTSSPFLYRMFPRLTLLYSALFVPYLTLLFSLWLIRSKQIDPKVQHFGRRLLVCSCISLPIVAYLMFGQHF